jgi:CRISPR-associated exonuclease Cas4
MRDEDLLPISALQHLVFCERQCALIHVEREWAENQRTAEGHTLHERVDEGYREYRRGVKQFAGIYVRSLALGLYGRLDMLELQKVEEAHGTSTCAFLGLDGSWELHPVEFKRGKPKKHLADHVQLCAQAMCLEEMTASAVASGSMFYGEIRRREQIQFNTELRLLTTRTAARFKEIVERHELPPPVWKKHCRACSLIGICQPRVRDGTRTQSYRDELFG